MVGEDLIPNFTAIMRKLDLILMLLICLLAPQCQKPKQGIGDTETKEPKVIKSITTNEYKLSSISNSESENWQFERQTLELYDTLGRIIQTNKYSKRNELLEIAEHEYVNGLKMRSLYKNEGLTSVDSFFYDRNGRKVRESRYFVDEKKFEQSYQIFYEYNQLGYCVLTQMIIDTETKTWKHVYDSNGYEIEQLFQKGDGEFEMTYKQEFDDYGNCTKRRVYKGDMLSKVVTYAYEYNPEGDWIERRTFFNDHLAYKSSREIKYYDLTHN